MQHAIDHFLRCTVEWTLRWFNKPKFHIIRHLPFHVRRFGPAILFATEGFKSFNGVIRAESVNSNRHAPSKDIAVGFANHNRVRHFLSGGVFLLHDQIPMKDSRAVCAVTDVPLCRGPHAHRQEAWRTIGFDALALAWPGGTRRNFIAKQLGLEDVKEVIAGLPFLLLRH